MNTSCGNCLIMCALIWTYAKEKDIHIKLVNNGDDCVVFMESEDLARYQDGFEAWFLRMGFRMLSEKPVYQMSQIEFCQMRPIEMPDGSCRMVRNIPTALRKDSLCTIALDTAKGVRGWMTAVGTGGIALTGGVPVIQNFYRAMVRLGNGTVSKVATELARHSGMAILAAAGAHVCFAEPSAETRLQVYVAWGITPDQQLAFENYYDQLEFDWDEASACDTHTNFNTIFHALSR
jgi:hypothetical protein